MYMHDIVHGKFRLGSSLTSVLPGCRGSGLGCQDQAIETGMDIGPAVIAQFTPQRILCALPMGQRLAQPRLPLFCDLQRAAAPPAFKTDRNQAFLLQWTQIPG